MVHSAPRLSVESRCQWAFEFASTIGAAPHVLHVVEPITDRPIVQD